MAKRMNGAGVNRSAARKASEVASLREARRVAYEKGVKEAVAVFFDRVGRAGQVRSDAQVRVEKILVEAEGVAVAFDGEADRAVVTLKTMGEPVIEIAEMTGLPVTGVRAALARAGAAPGG